MLLRSVIYVPPTSGSLTRVENESKATVCVLKRADSGILTTIRIKKNANGYVPLESLKICAK